MEKSGGAEAFSQSVYRFVNTKFKAQICAWAGGILIFFSDEKGRRSSITSGIFL